MRRSIPGQKRKDVAEETPRSAEICKRKVFENLRQRSVDKAAEFISDVDLRARHIASIHQKFLKVGCNSRMLTEEVALEILNRIARGESLKKICEDGHLPNFATVMKWVKTDPDFQQAYVEAKEFQMNVFADDILSIADDSVGDIRMAFDKNGNIIPEVNYENVKRSELKIKTRQWLMERFAKKQFSLKDEKSDTGSTRAGNVQIQIMLPDNGRQIALPEMQVIDL